jgi:glutathione S-transferase
MNFQEAANTKYYAEKLPIHYQNLEKLIKLYGHDGYCVGDSLSLADLCIQAYTDSHYRRDPSLKEAFPLVHKVVQLVEANPKVAEYLQKRPFTNF